MLCKRGQLTKVHPVIFMPQPQHETVRGDDLFTPGEILGLRRTPSPGGGREEAVNKAGWDRSDDVQPCPDGGE